MNWSHVRDFLQQSRRENGDCSVKVILASGERIGAYLTINTPAPHTWPEGLIILTTQGRTSVTTHVIDVNRIDALSVVGLS